MKNVVFTEDAVNDYLNLAEYLKTECNEMLNKLSANIHLGRALENKNGRDLSDCYKIYFNEARYRIVYRKIDNVITIQSVESTKQVSEKTAEVLGIGERNREHIYKVIASRLGR